MTRKHYVPLGLRVVRNLLILTAMAALTVAMVRFPMWKEDRFVRDSMRAHGLTGKTPVLWKGDVCVGRSKLKMRLYAEDDQIYAGWIESYEGRAYVRAYRGRLPEGPAVAPISPELTWTMVRDKLDGEPFFQLMAVNLPEEAAGGRLTVEPEQGGSFSVEAEREQGIIPFFPTGKQMEVNLWENTAWTLGGYGSLKGSGYTLTLWDGDGAVIVETKGTLESIWEA